MVVSGLPRVERSRTTVGWSYRGVYNTALVVLPLDGVLNGVS